MKDDMAWRPFGDMLATPLRNGLTRPTRVRGSGVKMVNMGELFEYPRIGDIEMERVPLSEQEAKSYLLEASDLLFARQSLVYSGAGKCSIFLGASEPVTFEGHLIRARLNPSVGDPMFYFYFFDSTLGRKVIGQIIEQVAAAGIRGSDLAKLEVPYPPIEKQRAIGRISAAFDDKIELNRQMNQTLEAIARAIFKSWFVDFDPVWAKMDGEQPYGMDAETAALFPDTFTDSPIGPIPEGWMVKRLSDICESVRYGYTASAKLEKVGPKFLRITDIVPYSINWDTVPYCEIEDKDLDKYLLKEGDIVVARTGATVGYAKRIGKRHPKAVFASYLVRMRIHSNYSNYLIGLIVESDEYKEFIWTNRGGSAQPQANAKVMTSYSIILPPNKLQQRFDDAVKALLDYRELLQQESRTLAKLRDTLLPKLISGQLRISDVERFVGEVV